MEAPAAEAPAKLSKKEAARARPLRSQAILAAAHTATPVHQIRGGVKKAQKNGNSGVVAASGGNTGLARQGKNDATRLYDLWDDGPSALSRAARKKAATRSLHRDAVRAVEVDAPGCSFNPDPEEQQEAIAVAVAAEMKKIHQQVGQPRSWAVCPWHPVPWYGALQWANSYSLSSPLATTIGCHADGAAQEGGL